MNKKMGHVMAVQEGPATPSLSRQAHEEPYTPLALYRSVLLLSRLLWQPKEALISGNRFTHPHSNCSQTCKPRLLISSSTGQDSRAYSKMHFAFISTDFLSPLTRYPIGLQSSPFYFMFYGLESAMGK